MTDYPETPECDRLVAVADESHKIGEFLDWLSEQGIWLAQYRDVGYMDEQLCVLAEQPERVLARFFEIDLDKVEAERRAILKAIQS